jgi:hypothetical protein
MQTLCRDRDRYIAAHPRDTVGRVLAYELAFTRRVAAVETPASMAGVRRHLVFERRRFDGVTRELYRGMIHAEDPQAFYAGFRPRIDAAAGRSGEAFARVGLNCVTGPG